MIFSNFCLLIWMRLPFKITQPADGFSSASRRSLFSPMRKYFDASSTARVYISQIGTSLLRIIVTAYVQKKDSCNYGQNTDGWRPSSTGLSPPRGSHTAILIACDAFNARTVAVREYHCPACTSSPISSHAYVAAGWWSLRCFRRNQHHGAPAVRLGADRMCPYAL